MFSLHSDLELRRITISSLITCIYLPSIITVISYKGLLYSVGNASSFYILALIFIAELLKSFYLNSNNDIHAKKAKQSKNKVGDMFMSLMFLLCVMFCFFIGIILFGAPVLDNHEETLILSALLTLLTVFPLLAHTGMESSLQLLFCMKHFGKNTIVQMLVNNALLAICGAWLGATVIPLDWNTPWQVWPIPCYLGAIAGFLLANVIIVVKVALMVAAQVHPLLNILVYLLDHLQVGSRSHAFRRLLIYIKSCFFTNMNPTTV